MEIYVLAYGHALLEVFEILGQLQDTYLRTYVRTYVLTADGSRESCVGELHPVGNG